MVEKKRKDGTGGTVGRWDDGRMGGWEDGTMGRWEDAADKTISLSHSPTVPLSKKTGLNGLAIQPFD